MINLLTKLSTINANIDKSYTVVTAFHTILQNTSEEDQMKIDTNINWEIDGNRGEYDTQQLHLLMILS